MNDTKRFKIVLVELPDDEKPELLNSEGMLDLHAAVKLLAEGYREEAQRTHGHGAWGAVRAFESATYYLFGVAGWLAKDEGRLDPKPTPTVVCSACGDPDGAHGRPHNCS